MNTQVGAIDTPTAGVSFSQTHTHIREWILLDIPSSIYYFTDPSLVQDFHDSKECLMISTNSGQSKTKRNANVPKWGEVWFNKNGIAKIFSLASMIKCHRVTFDSDKKAKFLVHTPKVLIKFIMSPERLFYHAPCYCTASQLTQTVAQNESFYSHQQKERAKRSHELLHMLACPTVEDLKEIIKMN